MNKITKGYIFIFASVFAASMFSITVDYVFRNYPETNPANLLFWSLLGAILFTSPFFLIPQKSRKNIQKITKEDKKFILIVALISTLGAFLWNFSIKDSSSGIVMLLAQSTTVFSFLLGIIFLKERFVKRELLAVFILGFGIFLISNLEGEVSKLTVGVILFASFIYALISLYTKKFGEKISMKSFSFIRAIAVCTCIGIFLGITNSLEILPIKVFIIGGISEVFGVILWAWFYFESHKYLDMSKLNIISSLDALFVPLLAFFIFNDPLSNQKILGMGIIIMGTIFFMREQRKRYSNK